jgi:protocatechuate 3,4-dioxygenase beta subunit
VLGIKLIGSVAAAAFGALLTFTGVSSGPNKGDMLSAFEPTHVTGQDAGTETCPVCKYGNLPAVQVWVNNDLPSADVTKIAVNLDKQMARINKDQLHFKSFVIFRSNDAARVQTNLKALANGEKLDRVALAWLTPANEALKLYAINPEAKTTVLVYKNRCVMDKFVDMKVDEAGLRELNAAIARITK